jgi:transketolase
MPETNLFDAQDESYKNKVLPKGIKRIAIEAGVPDSWYRYVGIDGKVIGISRFGESAPAADVYEYLGVTTASVVSAARKLLD